MGNFKFHIYIENFDLVSFFICFLLFVVKRFKYIWSNYGTAPFIFSLKTSEYIWFSNVFRKKSPKWIKHVQVNAVEPICRTTSGKDEFLKEFSEHHRNYLNKNWIFVICIMHWFHNERFKQWYRIYRIAARRYSISVDTMTPLQRRCDVTFQRRSDLTLYLRQKLRATL